MAIHFNYFIARAEILFWRWHCQFHRLHSSGALALWAFHVGRHRRVSNLAEPAKVAGADNTFAKTSGATVDWRKFDGGASVVRALGLRRCADR